MLFGGYSATVDDASFVGTWNGENVPVSITAEITPVPEPGSLVLIGSGLLAGAMYIGQRHHLSSAHI